MAAIPEQTIREILDRISAVKLVGEFVPLKKAGTRWKGLCPFHHERTPSFTVNEELGFFHCFGCGESGDAIGFLRKHLGLGFTEAVEQLASRAGVEVRRDGDPAADRAQRARRAQERVLKDELHEVLERTCEWYHGLLKAEPRNSRCWRYLEERGLGEQTVDEFRLGVAPEDWGRLAEWLASRRLSLQHAEALGLVVPRKTGQGFYDRFRSRLLFPIYDLTERVIGFGGRRLPSDSEEDREVAKYINSPDSAIYNKGDVLFDLAQAKKHIRTEGAAVLVEGNIDLLTLHQEGFRNTVAPMGTALTGAQVQLLRRFADEVVLLYDGDGAGRAAAMKSLHLLLEAGLHGRVALLPDGEDPDSFVRRRGSGALRALLHDARPLMEHLIGATVEGASRSDHDRARALATLAPFVSAVQDRRERDLYVSRVASALQLPEGRVAGMLRNPQRLMEAEASTRRVDPLEGAPLRERKLVEVCLEHPPCLAEADCLDGPSLLTHDALRRVLWEAVTLFGETGRLDGHALCERLSDSPLRDWAAERLCAEPELGPETAVEVVREGFTRLRGDRWKTEQKRLREQIQQAERSGEVELLQDLVRELHELAQMGRAQTAQVRSGGSAGG